MRLLGRGAALRARRGGRIVGQWTHDLADVVVRAANVDEWHGFTTASRPGASRSGESTTDARCTRYTLAESPHAVRSATSTKCPSRDEPQQHPKSYQQLARSHLPLVAAPS